MSGAKKLNEIYTPNYIYASQHLYPASTHQLATQIQFGSAHPLSRTLEGMAVTARLFPVIAAFELAPPLGSCGIFVNRVVQHLPDDTYSHRELQLPMFARSSF